MPQDTSKIAPIVNAAASRAADTSNLADDLRSAFDLHLLNRRHIVLAVSGGPDSMGLLHLVADWITHHNQRADARACSVPSVSVVTVDHGLRDASAAEAHMVAGAAASYGWQHATLRWTGPKPKSGLQAKGREARGALIGAHLAENGWTCVLMAHTADDQAETLMMRLARGSGTDGLAAMRATRTLQSGVTIVRPLLSVRKADLICWLHKRGARWANDPSNQDKRFERVRVRQALLALPALGVSLDSKPLGLAAMRAARAADALQDFSRLAWGQRSAPTFIHPHGWAQVDWLWLRRWPEEVRLRLLQGIIEAVGGAGRVSLGQLEQHTVGQGWIPQAITMNGVQIRPLAASSERSGGDHDLEDTQYSVRFLPEPGRHRRRLPPILLAPASRFIWEGRFVVCTSPGLPAGIFIGSLGTDGAKRIEALWRRFRPKTLRVAVEKLPALWRGDLLCAVPALDYFDADARFLLAGTVITTFQLPTFAMAFDKKKEGR